MVCNAALVALTRSGETASVEDVHSTQHDHLLLFFFIVHARFYLLISPVYHLYTPADCVTLFPAMSTVVDIASSFIEGAPPGEVCFLQFELRSIQLSEIWSCRIGFSLQ